MKQTHAEGVATVCKKTFSYDANKGNENQGPSSGKSILLGIEELENTMAYPKMGPNLGKL